MRIINTKGARTAIRYLPAALVIIIIIFVGLYLKYPDRIEDVTIQAASSVISSLVLMLTLLIVFGRNSAK